MLPFAAGFVTRRIEELGGRVSRRTAGPAFYPTDQNNAVLDCKFATINQPRALVSTLSTIPGLLGHNLFIDDINAAYISQIDGVIHRTRDTVVAKET